MDVKTMAAGSGLLGATSGWLNQLSSDHLGVNLGVIAFAFAGTCLSYCWDSDDLPELSKPQMYRRIAVTTFLTTAMVALLPQWLGWEWSDKLNIPLAMFVSASARFVIPIGISLAPAIMRKWFNLEPAESDHVREVNWEAAEEEEAPKPKARRKKT